MSDVQQPPQEPSPSQGGTDGNVPPPAPPPDVAAAAAAHDLGTHLGVRGWGRPRDAWTRFAIAAGVFAAVLVVGVLWASVLRIFVVVLLLWLVTALGRAIVVTGHRDDAVHLFAGGVVRRDRGGVLVAPWSRVARLGRSTRRRGVSGGRRFPLVLTDGAIIEIPWRPVPSGQDPFLVRLADLLRRAGRRVD